MKREIHDRAWLPILVIGMGILLRAFVAWWTIDILHPDEHYQTLEPAYHILTQGGFLTWEWTQRVRSWFVPGLYTIPLYLARAFFGLGGPLPIHLCRLFTVLCTADALFGFFRVLKLRKLDRRVIVFTLAIFCLHPTFVILGAATLSDTWALITVWASFSLVISHLEQSDTKKSLIAGFLASLSFFIRIQMLAWMGGLALAVFFCYPKRKTFCFALGMTVGVLCQGLWDWVTWGDPFISTLQNLRINLLLKGADTYGVSPWYAYFWMIPEHVGAYWTAGWIAVLLLAFRLKKREFFRTRNFAKQDLLVLLPVICFSFAHMVIPHKEVRFFYPILPGFLYLFAVSANVCLRGHGIQMGKEGPRSEGYFAKFTIALICAFAALSFWAVQDRARYNHSNMSELMVAMWGEKKLRNADCLALFGHFGVWSHGNLLQNLKLRYADLPDRTHLYECPYAVVARSHQERFSNLTGGSWPLVTENYWRYRLYRRP